MGTRFEVFLRGQDEEHLDAVSLAVLEEVVRLDGVLSRFNPSSEIARVNREAGNRVVRVDREVFSLLEQCEQARILTDGYFDVTQGTGFALDAETCSVQFTRPDATIDLGAVGKGYALNCGREILLRYGVTCGLLQGGTSSVLAVGNHSWPIDLRHPLLPEVNVSRIDLLDRGFSCSAVRHHNQQQSDIVNPVIRQPLNGSAACYVFAQRATEAEVLSTALLAMGREQAVRFLRQTDLPGVQVGWIEPAADFFWMKD
jgi:thiamine biosynthesis lipoprotein